MAWTPRDGEGTVFYNPVQRKRYEANLASEYDPWAWPSDLLIGRDQRATRCFAEVAVRAHFERQGYQVLLSAPKYPGERGFILFHFRGLRRRNPPHKAFKRMQEHFPGVDLDEIAEDARRIKIEQCRKRGVVATRICSSSGRVRRIAFSLKRRIGTPSNVTSLSAFPSSRSVLIAW